MDAKALIEAIQQEKRDAVVTGTLREEKPLAKITEKEIPRKLPEGWQWCRLGDYAMKVTDYVASGSFASLKANVLITNEENYAVMVKTADFANGFTKNLTYTDEHGYRFLENSNLFGGELILSNIGSIGKVFIVPNLNRPMTLASNTVMIRMTHNEYNKYMYYMFISPFGQKLLMSISSGTSMLKFNKTQLKSTIIPIAPLEKQNEICDVLDRMQSIISKRKNELQELDELIKARFVEMFGDPATNPMQWHETTVGTECHYIKDGPHKSLPDIGKENGGHPFISVRNIVNHTIDFSSAKYISDEDYKEARKKCCPEKGDMLYSKGGTTGIAKLIDTDIEFANWVHIAVLKFDKNKLNGIFFENMLNSEYCYDQSQRLTKGIANRDLVLSAMAKIKMYRPELDLQEQFATFVTQVDKSKVINRHLRKTIKKQR